MELCNSKYMWQWKWWNTFWDHPSQFQLKYHVMHYAIAKLYKRMLIIFQRQLLKVYHYESLLYRHSPHISQPLISNFIRHTIQSYHMPYGHYQTNLPWKSIWTSCNMESYSWAATHIKSRICPIELCGVQ